VKNQTAGVKSQSYELFEYEMNLASLIEKSERRMQNTDGDQEMSSGETSAPARCDFELGDFSFESDGSVNVILTNRDTASPVYIFKVSDLPRFY
jgi:hypothetical protein